MKQNPDVVIVGGAAMGSATAYYLRTLEPNLDVLVVEKDPSYRRSSTVLSDGNVRVQFNLEENIRMSRFAMTAVDDFSARMTVGDWIPEPAPRHQGNLFLTDSAGKAATLEGLELQKSLGCEVEWLDREEVGRRFPLYAGDGYEGGVLGRRDGSVDPNAVLQGYVRKSTELGARYITGEVIALRAAENRIAGLTLAGGKEINTPVIVNAAGAWCAPVAATVGVAVPVEPVMRTVYAIDTRLDNKGHPSVFLPNGLYVIPESDSRFLVGWSQPDDPVGYDFSFSRRRFNDLIWPELSRQLPAFEALHLNGGWTGLYEVNTLDGNGIIGEWPALAGLYLANGFSGHGFQHCHAVGRHLAELILNRPTTLDLRRLGPQRVLDNQPLYENASRII